MFGLGEGFLRSTDSRDWLYREKNTRKRTVSFWAIEFWSLMQLTDRPYESKWTADSSFPCLKAAKSFFWCYSYCCCWLWCKIVLPSAKTENSESLGIGNTMLWTLEGKIFAPNHHLHMSKKIIWQVQKYISIKILISNFLIDFICYLEKLSNF